MCRAYHYHYSIVLSDNSNKYGIFRYQYQIRDLRIGYANLKNGIVLYGTEHLQDPAYAVAVVDVTEGSHM
jgi:hypothetical protein